MSDQKPTEPMPPQAVPPPGMSTTAPVQPGFTDPAPPAGSVPSIALRNVSKWFGELVAVSDVSFEVGPGVTALLGPNGAGKSTCLRMISGLTAPGQGTVEVMGKNPRTDREVAGSIGVVPQQEKLFDELRPLDFVGLMAELQGVDKPNQRAREALEIVELDPDDTRSITAYSKGMRQRVKVAQAIVHDPHVLLLDEPLTGLDPRQRLHMVELFTRLGAQGRCVLVSSHVLDEVERLGSRVLVIAQGRLAAQGDFHEIRAMMDHRPHRMKIRTSKPREVAGSLLSSGIADGVQVNDAKTVSAETQNVAAFRTSVAQIAAHHDARLFEVVPLDDDLESVFRYLVGR